MKIQIKITTFLVVLLLSVAGLFISCTDWTQTESVDLKIDDPQKQHPAEYAAYIKALCAYKQSDHIRTYARLDNAPEVSLSEQDFLRSLPDSLDFVAFYNADHLSQFDLADIDGAQAKGTRVLYYIDYARSLDKGTTLEQLGTYLDQVVAKLSKYHFDGVVLAGVPVLGVDAAAQQAAAQLCVAKLTGKQLLLLFEGDPLFLAEADRTQFDYFVLNTASIDNITDIQLTVRQTIDILGIPASKLFLSTSSGRTILSTDLAKVDALTEVAHCVLNEGPLGGLGIFNISAAYYDPLYTYKPIGEVIALLNSSHKN